MTSARRSRSRGTDSLLALPVAIALLASGAGARAASPAEPAASDSNCNAEATKLIAFSGSEARDRLRVTIAGASCATAVFSVEIRAPRGAKLYAFRKPFAAFFGSGEPIERQPLAQLRERARDFVDAQLPSAALRPSTSLPAYRKGPFERDEFSSSEVLVDRTRYERLTRAALPVYSHSTANEVQRDVVWDPKTRTAVAILDTWM